MNIERTFIIICLLALSVCALAVEAQQGETLPPQFEKGDLSELKDKQRVYVNATSTHQSENILKELKKYPGVQVVSAQADADFVVAYRIERKQFGTSADPHNPIQKNWTYYGRLLVYVPQTGGVDRLLWETSLQFQIPPPVGPPPLPDMRRNWEQPLEKSATGKFIKALKKSRGEK
ncbi:MAG TPA: hypothetical protein VGO91_16780 [Pyrinomonadaceae bacterium]|jgi:hypothetical protein|nr:hypothetical protein [Pyrinomonadaceae bacterium]